MGRAQYNGRGNEIDAGRRLELAGIESVGRQGKTAALGAAKLRALLQVGSTRKLREYLTGYLMILPSTLLIFLFGLFPVAFAAFVSLHNWRLKRGEILGLDNFVRAVDDLAYILLYAVALLAAVGALRGLRALLAESRQQGAHLWLHAIPAALQSAAVFQLVRWAFLALPHVLDIADQIIGVEKTRALFFRLLGEALAAPEVVAAARSTLLLLAAGAVVGLLLARWAPLAGALVHQFRMAVIWLMGGAAVLLASYTYREMLRLMRLAQQEGEAGTTWPHLLMIVSGALLLIAAWRLWRQGTAAAEDRVFLWKLLAAMALLVAGWALIAGLPPVIAAGDPDVWEGLKVTVFFSVGTVPFQLAFAMFLAVLLFEKLRGSELFRMLFFLPYVTPLVASAAVFRQLFSNRVQSPINQLLLLLGVEPQRWLYEPKGVFDLLGEAAGLELPAWAVGPSLALVVVIIHSIWTYVGYDAVIYLAGLGNIDRELIEAAEIDGANSWQVFRFIIFPLLSPTTYFLSLIAIIGTFKAFTQIWVMRLGAALGTTDTFSVTIFAEFFEKLRYGYASALALVLFAVILVLTLLNNRIQGSRVFYG